MGMFDDVRCKYPLPDPEMQGEAFQTKSFPDPYMEKYEIAADGRLLLHAIRLDSNPNHDPDKSWFTGDNHPFVRVELGPREVPFHGDLRFYTSHEGEWFEYVARFTNGRVEWIQRVEEDAAPERLVSSTGSTGEASGEGNGPAAGAA